MLGNFDRGESYYGKEKRKTLDHDFLSHASGVVIPHGIYDCFDNKGYITLGTRGILSSLFVIISCIIGKTICNGFIPMHKACLFCAMEDAPIRVATIS